MNSALGSAGWSRGRVILPKVSLLPSQAHACPQLRMPEVQPSGGSRVPGLVSINLALHQLQNVPHSRQCPECLGSQALVCA